jgi:hypothetical protein
MVQLILFIAPLYNFTVQKNDCYMFLLDKRTLLQKYLKSE